MEAMHLTELEKKRTSITRLKQFSDDVDGTFQRLLEKKRTSITRLKHRDRWVRYLSSNKRLKRKEPRLRD